MPTLEDHPLAAIFPLMGDADLAALGADIDANGLRDAVWLFEGKILDGRNRYRACTARDIDHRVEHYKGKDPLGFVLSKNLHRRHLTESQRAMVAARFANLQSTPSANLQSPTLGESVKAAAALMSVSPRLVESARAVAASGVPELVAAVESGAVAASAAAEVAELPPEEQKEAVAAGQVPAKAKERRKAKATLPKPANEVPDTEPDPEPEVVVTHAGADKAAAAVDVIVRSLKRSKAMLSGLMTGPYAQLLKNVSESVTHCKLYATGEMLSKGEWGSITYGIGEYSTPAIDEMLTLCGGMKLALSRAEAVAVEMEATAAPGEAWQLGQDLGEDDDRITF
jgi:DNA-binding transcriptional regulator YdaS (Cro superfamily)